MQPTEDMQTPKIIDRRPALIPPTTFRTYLSGFTALNIPAPEGTGGDWHAPTALLDPGSTFSLAGEGPHCFVNANAVFGKDGIHECSDTLRGMGATVAPGARVYAGNHYRAIVDLLVEQARARLPVFDLIDPEDYLDTQEHLRELARWLNRWAGQLNAASEEAQFIRTWRTRYSI